MIFIFIRFFVALIYYMFILPRVGGFDKIPWYARGENLFLILLLLVLSLVEPICFVRYCRGKKWLNASISLLFVIFYFWLLWDFFIEFGDATGIL